MTSRLISLLTQVRALPPSPIRPEGSTQLSNALEAILNRSTGIAGSESRLGKMEAALQRIRNNEAAKQVRIPCWLLLNGAHLGSIPYQIDLCGPHMIHTTIDGY